MELFSKKEVIGLPDNFPIQQNAWLFKKIILKNWICQTAYLFVESIYLESQ